MPPCGSPLITTTKSVPLPVSLLSGSSETISEEPGETTSAMRSMASCGMAMRSSAALAASDVRRGGLGVAIDPSAPAARG